MMTYGHGRGYFDGDFGNMFFFGSFNNKKFNIFD